MTKNVAFFMVCGLYVLARCVLTVIFPFIVIWVANSLFPALAIPYTLGTWAAILILAACIKVTVSFDNKSIS